MKLNLEFYKNDIKYNKLDKEDEIINDYILKLKEEDYESVFETDNNIETLSALSDIRKNIISWYPFEENATILEIGAGLGEITGELCKKSSKVVSIEFSKQRGEAIAKRHEKKENLEVIIGNLKDIKFEEKFDYITLIGILEYAPIIYNTENSFIDLLKLVKELLKENGKLLLATNNKFSMRNWSVKNVDDKNLEYDAICSFKDNNESQLFTKAKLDEMLKKVGLENKKYYYPLPDYKFTNVIFTQDYMPTLNNLNRNMTFFKDSDIINFHENNAYKEVLTQDKKLFDFFANSYLVEIGQNVTKNNIKFITYWNNRKPEYRLRTVIQGDKVYKYNTNNLSKNHIQTLKNNIDILNKSGIKTLDSYDEEKTISKYVVNCKSYDEIIIEGYDNYGIEKVIELINNFKNKIINKLEATDSKDNVFDKYGIPYNNQEIEGLHFVKNGLWDLNFQNCFEIDNDLYVYDQEWIDNNVPVEYIIYRDILIFEELKKRVDINELYERLNLSKYVELFYKLVKATEEKIMSEPIKKAHNRPIKNVLGLYVENENLKNQNNELNNNLQNEKIKNETSDKKIQEMQDTINVQLAKIDFIESSRGWKLIVKIRKIFSYLKFWKKK